uniref:Uncharacterized protein n=1 Tax=Sipha flava TaxID=143950 RepID=A0A2S2Q0Y2_9HEMI
MSFSSNPKLQTSLNEPHNTVGRCWNDVGPRALTNAYKNNRLGWDELCKGVLAHRLKLMLHCEFFFNLQICIRCFRNLCLFYYFYYFLLFDYLFIYLNFMFATYICATFFY